MLTLLIAACGATAEPQTIVQTVEVEKEVTVVETVEVEKEVTVVETVEVEKEVTVVETVEVEKEVIVTPTPEPVTIQFWTEFTAPPKTDVVDEWIAGFQEEYPWITVEHRGISNEVYGETWRTAMLGGDPPDLFVTGTRGHLTDTVPEGLIYDLTNFYNEYSDRFVPGYELNSVINGRTYAIPWTLLVLDLIWYDNQIMDKYDLDPQSIETFEDLMDTCETLKENGEVCFAFGGGGAGWTGGHWVMMLLQNNMPMEEWMKLMTREKSWTDPDVVEILSNFERMVAADYMAPGAAADDRDAGRALYFQGQGAFWSAGSWHLYMKGGDLAPPDWEYNFIPFPPLAANKDLNVVMSDSNIQWTVSSASEHIDETLLFLEYITRLENAQLWVKDVQEFIAVKGAVTEETAGPEMAAIAEYVEGSNVEPFMEHYLPVPVRNEGHWTGSVGVLSGQIDTQEWAELIDQIHEAEGVLPFD
jgi:raffinose/stachyose/melibiose transport system substrate-binding protein